jgi:hypothetical protein
MKAAKNEKRESVAEFPHSLFTLGCFGQIDFFAR